jgi:hypothetical protein
MTIDDLKQEALDTCRWRGHVMSPFDEFLVSECVVCGLTAYLDEYPARTVSSWAGVLWLSIVTTIGKGGDGLGIAVRVGVGPNDTRNHCPTPTSKAHDTKGERRRD